MTGDKARSGSFGAIASKTIAARIALVTLNVAYILVLADLLGAQDYGIVAIAIATSLVFLNLSFAGANWSLSVEVARSPEDQTRLLGEYLVTRFLTVGLACVLCAAWGLSISGGGATGTLISIFALAIVPRSLAMLHIAVLLGRGDADKAIINELGARFFEIVLVLAGLVVMNFGLNWIPMAHLIAWGALCAALRRKMPQPAWPQGLGATIRSVLWRGAPYGALSAAVVWLSQSAVFNASAKMVPSQAVGWIALSVSLVTVVLALLQSIIAPMAPRLAGSARGGTKFGSQVLAIGLCATLALGLICDLMIEHVAPLVIAPLIGEDYLGIAMLHAPIAWMVAALFAMTLSSSLVGYYKRTWFAAALAGLGVLATLAVLAVLPERHLPTTTLFAAATGASFTAIALSALHYSMASEGRRAFSGLVAGPVFAGAGFVVYHLAIGTVPIAVQIAAAALVTVFTIAASIRLALDQTSSS